MTSTEKRARWDIGEVLDRTDLTALLDRYAEPAGTGRLHRWHCPVPGHDDIRVVARSVVRQDVVVLQVERNVEADALQDQGGVLDGREGQQIVTARHCDDSARETQIGLDQTGIESRREGGVPRQAGCTKEAGIGWIRDIPEPDCRSHVCVR